MTFRIGLAQSGFPADGDVLAQVEGFAARAEEAGCKLLVFPENLMYPRWLTPEEMRDISEPLEGPFVTGIGETSRAHGLWTIITTLERNPAGGHPFNTAIVLDDAGTVRRTYRKCHLYNAHGVRESDQVTAGDALCEPIQTSFGVIGVGICYDLRFPEVARAAAVAGCELLVYPAAWHDGPGKADHWETLLRARAIENELFAVGVCHAGERYVERSLVVDPQGNVVARGDVGEARGGERLVICDIDVQAVHAAREAMPVLEHRRPGLYR